MPRVHCPSCGSSRIFRARYEGVGELLRLTPLRPYGCRNCQKRFVDWSRHGKLFGTWRGKLMKLALSLSASCPTCRARDLEPVSNRQMHERGMRRVFSLLHIPAYRCRKCNRKFYKLRHHIRHTPRMKAKSH